MEFQLGGRVDSISPFFVPSKNESETDDILFQNLST